MDCSSRVVEFSLNDYRLYDYLNSVLESFDYFDLSYSDVKGFMNERSFYYSKKKFLELGILKKEGIKRYSLIKN